MINAVTSGVTDTTAANAAMKKDVGLDQDAFLQLLVAQIKNQDPMNPQDSSAFVQQLAQLSQVQQTYNINTNLKNLLTSQNNGTTLSSVSFIGKNVTAQQGDTTVQGVVTGVDLSGDTPVLNVNGASVPLTSVISVKGGSM